MSALITYKVQNDNHLLVNFIDKMRNDKLFPNAKHSMEYWLWEAKLH